jgi:hypothetical protein
MIIKNRLMINENGIFKNEMKNYLKYIIFGVIFGTFVYLQMMSNDLVNNIDGIWHPSNFIAGNWEISLGRGLQRYADRARFGLVTSSFNTLLVLLLISIADVLVIRRFDLKGKLFSFLFIIMSIANPVVSESLSYSYMSVNFGLAYFFSVLAFFVLPTIGKRKWQVLRALLSGFLLAISMSFYQAYIGVFCVVIVFLAIKLLDNEEKNSKIGNYLLNAMISLFSGGIFYLIITKALLLHAGVELSSYRGANNISIGTIIKSLPDTLKECYIQFWSYFIEGRMNARLEFSKIVIISEILFSIFCF